MTKDMTRGNPGKILFLFALPILFGNIFQQLYSMVDSIVVGNFVGSDALAAVGGSYAITFAITGIAFGLSNGASILIGQYFGAGRKREVRHSIVTCVAFSIALSLVLAAVSILATPALLRLLNTPESLMSMSKQYIYIYFLGLVFTFTYNILSSVFRALGDSKTPLLFLIISSITNIVLDLWFVISFGWGVAGVAIATVISQALSSVLALFALQKRLAAIAAADEEKLDAEPLRQQFSPTLLKQMIKLAIPTTAQEIAISAGMMIMQALVNGFGPIIMAAYTAAMKIESLAMMPMVNISTAVTGYTAQNIGAGKVGRVKTGYRYSLLISLGFAVLMAGVVVLFGGPLCSIFVSGEGAEAVISAGANYLLYSAASYFLMALLFPAEGVMKGAGDVNLFMVFALSGIASKTIAALALSPILGYTGIWIAVVIGWLAECIGTTVRYLTGRWKDKAIVRPAPSEEVVAQ
ncbi:MATE family efflux transporter [bacterium 210820-DFI.6.52]|nr:MATE family efflux transporter [bacterium 210820-DFI.6.52]